MTKISLKRCLQLSLEARMLLKIKLFLTIQMLQERMIIVSMKNDKLSYCLKLSRPEVG